MNVPPVALVDTTVLYLVRVRIPQAVACEQLHLVSGYCCVPVPMVMTTGALMVVAAGIACATTMQYLQPFVYEPAGMFITRLPPVNVTLLEIISLSHNLQIGLQAILIPP